jgi:hypothetical protein
MARLLTFFGVPWRTLIKEEFVIQNACGEVSSKSRLVCSSVFAEASRGYGKSRGQLRGFAAKGFPVSGDALEI